MSARKFELLKDLPDCKAGAIYKQGEYPQQDDYVCYDNQGNWSVSYHKEQVENNPAWFKEVVDKEWEIVQYGWAQNNENKPEQQYIHSIKRLSDGELFSVGDFLDNIKDADQMITEIVVRNGKVIFCGKDYASPLALSRKLKLSSSTPSGTANGVLNTDEIKFKKEVTPHDLDWGELYEPKIKVTIEDKLTEEAKHKYEALKSWVDGIDERNQPQNNKERIEVKNIYLLGAMKGESSKEYDDVSYMVKVSEIFDGKKLPAIKQAIENVLNKDLRPAPCYSEMQVEERERKAFEAGRESNNFARAGTTNTYQWSPRYFSFEDYINSLHK